MQDGDEADEGCVYLGRHGQVRFARARCGTLMAKPDWDMQTAKWKSAFMARFINITSNQSLRLTSPQHFKQVEGELFEFKHNGHKSRIFCFRRENAWYLVDVFTQKKEDDLPPGVVRRALDLVEEAQQVLDFRTVRRKTT